MTHRTAGLVESSLLQIIVIILVVAVLAVFLYSVGCYFNERLQVLFPNGTTTLSACRDWTTLLPEGIKFWPRAPVR